jgi:glutamate dehydrogenase
MMLHIYYLVRRATRWFLRNCHSKLDIQKNIDEFLPIVNELLKHLPHLLEGPDKEWMATELSTLSKENVPEKLAKRVLSCSILFTSLDIIEIIKKYNLNLIDVAKTYYLLGSYLELSWLRTLINTCAVENQWDELARASLRDDLDRVQRKLSICVLTMKNKSMNDKSVEERINFWISRSTFLIDRWQKLIADIKESDSVDFVTHSVVLKELSDFAQVA